MISSTNLKSDDRLLEIGAGTGKATIQFANKGYRIHAVEMGEDMANILREKCSDFSNVTIDVSSFEEWACRDDIKFDMIYSAQAFHWINKDIKYRKCYELLKDNGYLVLFWYQPSGNKTTERIDLDEQVYRIVEKYISKYDSNHEKPDRITHTGGSNNEERKKEIDESGLFHIISEKEYTYAVINSPDQYVKAINIPLNALPENFYSSIPYNLKGLFLSSFWYRPTTSQISKSIQLQVPICPVFIIPFSKAISWMVYQAL